MSYNASFCLLLHLALACLWSSWYPRLIPCTNNITTLQAETTTAFCRTAMQMESQNKYQLFHRPIYLFLLIVLASSIVYCVSVLPGRLLWLILKIQGSSSHWSWAIVWKIIYNIVRVLSSYLLLLDAKTWWHLT